MQRLRDWETRLGGLLAAGQERPFEYGLWDCALFAAAVVEAMTGEDIAADWRGRYRTEVGGRRLMRRAGMADLFGPFDRLGDRAPLLLLRRGDIVSNGWAAGLMWQDCGLFLRPDIGFVRVPLRTVVHGWRIG